MKDVRILIVDDHPVVIEGLTTIIGRIPDYLLVGEAHDGLEAIEKVKELNPDIVIMDIVMTPMDGFLAIEKIKSISPKTKVIILSMFEQKEFVLRAFRAGAEGYIVKNLLSDELINAITAVNSGKYYVCPPIAQFVVEGFSQSSETASSNPFDSLSLREKEIIRYVLRGKTNNQVAESLSLSESTVKVYRKSALEKLGVKNATSLARLAVEKGFVFPSDKY